ncbi:SusF/SusE family outer membrane protein [Hymenobacter sp. RP-2-7]|uniref:SusF/SusE family outer membrane protein n=1 Tax=Hymenobacter polaris TaxID=2682546 RepID=A0A7Y0FLZ5_9BACT|nr:SusE domain-containing protein [Hymenobacter polaris]NML65323.1 SusF/SusE family outer membrane protein [Hymenobacter polaris]
MNTWFTRVATSAFALLVLGVTACKKDESQVVLKTAAAPALTTSTTAPDLVLTTTNANATAATFTYTAADFGFPAVTTYSLQIDKKGGTFSSPQVVASSTTPGTFTLTKSQLANAFFALGVAYGATAQVDARVVASVSTTAPTQNSSVVTLTGTPTPVCVPNTTGRTWSLIGPAGTDWNTDKALTYDCYTQTFKATMPLNAGEFKFRANNDWGVNFGTAGNTGDITNSALAKGVTLVNGKNNLQITTAGTYTITLSPSADGTTGTVIIKP